MNVSSLQRILGLKIYVFTSIYRYKNQNRKARVENLVNTHVNNTLFRLRARDVYKVIVDEGEARIISYKSRASFERFVSEEVLKNWKNSKETQL